MKSINEIEWKQNYIAERLILKQKQNFNISYLLSKIFLDKNYSDDEIYNSINKNDEYQYIYQHDDFVCAITRLLECVKEKKEILIFGDYDVDGYSSTYLLYDCFKNIKINCDYYIPDRFKDGYGPNKNLLKSLIKKKNYGLIFFVDCGSNSYDEINFLEKKGIKTIVIDHHQVYEHNSSSSAIIINPLKHIKNNYSFFCATSLVYFFINHLIKSFKININLDKYLCIAAIATICDQMPLRGYNKLIVTNGLKKLNFYKFPNFKNLLNIKTKITSTDIGFTLGPILNSASRLGYSDLPIKLLIEKKNIKIDKISNKLLILNEKRKKIQAKTIYFLKNSTSHTKSEIIFKYKENMNVGMLGIIASYFVENYNRPSFILTNSGNLIKCSSRSVVGFDIGNIFYTALKKKIIVNGGGHSMAAGCALKIDKLSEFKKFLDLNYMKKFKHTKNLKYYTSYQNIDSLLLFAKKELHFLEPLGNNNSNPLFLIKKNKILKIKVLKDVHLQFVIKNKYNRSFLCFAFYVIGTKLGDLLMNYKKEIDLIVQINNKIINKNSDFNLIIKDAIT